MPPPPALDPSVLPSALATLAARDDVKTRVVAALIATPTQQVTLAVVCGYVVVIAILPYLCELIYPFKLLTVGMHEMCHALAGVLTCGSVESISLDPREGGATRMRGGLPFVTLPAGYLGSSFIGACLIACGFDTCASRVACLVLSVFFVLTLFWARRSWIAWATIGFAAALIVTAWLVYHSIALRFLVLFLGVMSCLYCIWDIVDDTLKRKVNSSDASEYAKLLGFGGSRFWGAFWLFWSCVFFVAGILVGLTLFKNDWEQQRIMADTFLGGTP